MNRRPEYRLLAARLGKSRQVADSWKSWSDYWPQARQVEASLGKWLTPGKLGIQAMAARLGKSRQVKASG